MSKQIKIVHVSDDNCDVSLNVGSINGVQEGDKFLVYSLSDHEIVDPDTGGILRISGICEGYRGGRPCPG